MGSIRARLYGAVLLGSALTAMAVVPASAEVERLSSGQALALVSAAAADSLRGVIRRAGDETSVIQATLGPRYGGSWIELSDGQEPTESIAIVNPTTADEGLVDRRLAAVPGLAWKVVSVSHSWADLMAAASTAEPALTQVAGSVTIARLMVPAGAFLVAQASPDCVSEFESVAIEDDLSAVNILPGRYCVQPLIGGVRMTYHAASLYSQLVCPSGFGLCNDVIGPTFHIPPAISIG